MSKKGGNQIIMQIKGDNQQNLITKEFGVKQLENICNKAKEQIPLIPEMYQKSKESIIKSSDQANRIVQFERGRADFHIHAIVANRNDQILFHKHLVDLHNELMKRNDEYKEEVQQLRFQQQEMENKLKSQIEAVVHQLKGLRPFQERRQILIEQKKALEGLIFKEKQIHQDELTDIHHKLLDQREYYENDLRTRLEIAKKFAKTYADLHIDVLTKKIAESTSSKRKDLNSLETNLLNELYNIDNLVKTTNFYTKQNQILRKSIESATIQIIKYKQDKKDIEVQMLQTISNHQKELSETKDRLNEKESDITNIKIKKLREENERLKREASEAFEIMKKVENGRILGSDSFLPEQKDQSLENDLLKKMKDAADYVINALENKFGVTDDAIFLSQKTSMGKLIRRLTLIEKEVKKPLDTTMRRFYDTESIATSNNSQSDKNSDLEMNVDLNDLDNSNCVNNSDNENSDQKELDDINDTELVDSNSNSRASNNSNNFHNIDNNDYSENDHNINNDYYENENNDNDAEKTEDNTNNDTEDTDLIDEQNLKVDAEVQTEKPIRSNLLKGIKVPPTPPNYPYQFKSELTKTSPRSNFSKTTNLNKNRLNYLYYTYANTPDERERELINDNLDKNKFGHLNQPIVLLGETFTPQPPDIPISSQTKAKMSLRNESKNGSTIVDKRNVQDKYESTYFSRSLTPRRRTIQRHEYHVTPEFRKISNSGRMPSAYIRIIRAPK